MNISRHRSAEAGSDRTKFALQGHHHTVLDALGGNRRRRRRPSKLARVLIWNALSPTPAAFAPL
ncbi:hypothetical protein SGL43_07440 [Streptomyces globisporus]|uniref:Transposase n=1 Tax=Streptomyces globisporus TaxID=1908 RepID=A0ABM9H9N9_STRGL|nr:hypothetical protein SGL43_07440 [Streptomyces globisporus]